MRRVPFHIVEDVELVEVLSSVRLDVIDFQYFGTCAWMLGLI